MEETDIQSAAYQFLETNNCLQPDHYNFQLRLLLIDDQPLFLCGLSSILKATHQFEVVGEAHDGDTAIQKVGRLLPDIVIIALNNPDCTKNSEVCQQIKRRYPRIAVIILSLSQDTEQLLMALKAGASAYSSKKLVPQQLLDLVQQVGRGQYPINDEVLAKTNLARRAINQYRELEGAAVYNNNSHLHIEAGREAYNPLTSRELDILKGMAQGHRNKEIGKTLCISDQTVKNHITNILRKFHACDRTEAVMIAIREGWIRLPQQAALEVFTYFANYT